MTDPSQTGEPRADDATAPGIGRTWSVQATVTAPLTTVHLPPERAVLTTPAMIGLMERCITEAERESGTEHWQSRSVEVRHRAGLRLGEPFTTTAQLDEMLSEANHWRVRVEASDGRMIGDGVIIRVRS